jgi:hypothetical protein
MTFSPPLAPPARANMVTACRRCGGSGILRLADGRFRTCLDCLGQGMTPAVRATAVIPRVVAGSAHARSLRSPDEENCRAHDRSQGSGGQQQEKDGGPVCVHPQG